MSTGAPKTMICQASDCRKEFPAPVRAQGGGRPSKYCSATCRSRDWARNNGDKVAQAADRYDAKVESKEQKKRRTRKASLARYGVTQEWFEEQLARQRNTCLGCGAHITEETARIDHNHTTGGVRGLLCDPCNWALGHVKDSPETLRRLMAYLRRDISKPMVYIGGALKSTTVTAVAATLRGLGYDAMDEWITPGPEADRFLHEYEMQRGRGYAESVMHSRAVENTVLFDKSFIDMADAFVMVQPCGKSAHLELGYAAGQGIPTFILLDGDPERFDVMPALAGKVVDTLAALVVELSALQNIPRVQRQQFNTPCPAQQQDLW